MGHGSEQANSVDAFVILLVRLVALWLVYRVGEQLQAGVDQMWVDGLTSLASINLACYAINCSVACLAWTNSKRIGELLMLPEARTETLPLVAHSIDHKVIMQVVGLFFVVTCFPTVVQGGIDGFMVWETPVTFDGEYNNVMGFIAAPYWTAWLGSWTSSAVSILLGSWLVAGHPAAGPLLNAGISWMRTAGVYREDEPE